MVIDTSALLAILRESPSGGLSTKRSKWPNRERCRRPPSSEVSIVVEARHGAEGLRDLDLFLAKAAIEVVDVDIEQARAARTAFSRFGRGRHAAGLNYGDCFSYALASVRGEPLLYKGDDFLLTDIASPLSVG